MPSRGFLQVCPWNMQVLQLPRALAEEARRGLHVSTMFGDSSLMMADRIGVREDASVLRELVPATRAQNLSRVRVKRLARESPFPTYDLAIG